MSAHDDARHVPQDGPVFQNSTDEDVRPRTIHPVLLQDPQLAQALVQVILLAAQAALLSAKAVLESNLRDMESDLTGEMWVRELLNGHPECIRTTLGVPKAVFYQLIDELRAQGHTDSKHTTLEEQLSIFLYTCVTGLSRERVGERFQRTDGTITKYFCKMLVAFSSPPIYNKYVKLPRVDDLTPSCIANDPTVFPHFKDVLGAIDGAHVAWTPSGDKRAFSRGRNRVDLQNCLVCCNFNLEFVYVLSGWEGNAPDTFVYSDARRKELLIPQGKQYLADTGYPACSELMVPYRGIRYASTTPTNAQEYFNVRHAELRNVVERAIGALKRRFRILVIPPEYDMKLQACIPVALCCIHNVIRRYEMHMPSVDEMGV